MSSTRLTPDAITAEALRLFEIETPFIQNIDKQHDKETEYGGQKRGPSLRIRLPNQYQTRTGWAINVQEETETAVTLTIGSPIGVDMYFTEAELAQNINDFSRDHIRPAIETLAATLDSTAFNLAYKDVYNYAGTAGTHPNSALTWLNAGAVLHDSGTPKGGRVVIMDSNAEVATVNGTISLHNDPSKISKQYVSGRMGSNTLGFGEWFMSQNVPTHTCGSRSGTILVDDAAAANATEGSTTIHVDGLGGATQTFADGDIITVAGVYQVNPYTKANTGRLQPFVVTAAATAAGSEVDLTVSPAMYTTGARQNISAFPLDEAVVTVIGTASTGYKQNLVFHPEFCTFATANLEMPSDVHFKAQKSLRSINMRILRQYDINNSNYPCRIDVYYGLVVQRAQFAARVWGG